MPVTLGSEQLLRSGALAGARVGMVSNPASVDREFHHIADLMDAQPGITLAALFGPQHGFHAAAQDNMVETGHARDPRLGVPVYSLYSDTREPSAAMLDGIDVLVIDLQDVGTRVYTYIWTMANCLRAAARNGVPVIVCDRPNPIGGDAVEGPTLDPAYASFVGQLPIPLRHGMTVGELARLFNDEFGIGADLQVSAMQGWSRSMYHDETGAPWVIPSPNLPTLDSAIVYPGMVLLEGTMLSEGRGTTRPFELAGAPGIDPDALATRLNALGLPGVHVRAATFEPTFQKHAGAVCGGCQLHVTERRAFRPVATAIALIAACRDALGDRFRWREAPYEYETEKMPFDILAGTDALRLDIERGRALDAMTADWSEAATAFTPLRERYLLY